MRPNLLRQGWASCGIVAMAASAAISALIVAGGPGYARMERRDAERQSLLSDLDRQVSCLIRESGQSEVPTEIAPTPACPSPEAAVDPFTGTTIRAEQISAQKYRLCADFELPPPPVGYRSFQRDGDCIVFDMPDLPGN
ncbi:MAG: hypothetical protein DI498_13890 [Paracoccus denitrificans]|nr:MAG: hypothetical protein DI498_13890 [Paracoccus denitrificans]PZO82896.1 MAG: hypothetical protein DI633_13890 [Paracoccus denitrificans]